MFFNHGKDVMRNLAAAYGTNVIVSLCSELSTGLSDKVSAVPSVATHDGNSFAFTHSLVGVPSEAKGLSVRAFSQSEPNCGSSSGMGESAPPKSALRPGCGESGEPCRL